jgi:hypothetical protein
MQRLADPSSLSPSEHTRRLSAQPLTTQTPPKNTQIPLALCSLGPTAAGASLSHRRLQLQATTLPSTLPVARHTQLQSLLLSNNCLRDLEVRGRGADVHGAWRASRARWPEAHPVPAAATTPSCWLLPDSPACRCAPPVPNQRASRACRT